MRLRPFLAVAIGSIGLLACAQLIGIADTKDRIVMVDAGDAGDANNSGLEPCDTNVHCIDWNKGKPALCVEKQCVAVNESVCTPQVFPTQQGPEALKNDNVFLIPVFLPKTNLQEYPKFLAYNLALKELADGIPLEQRRPVAMLVCASEKESAPEGIKHVVTELKLPALIAGFGADDLTAYVRDVTKPNNVFVLNPSVAPQALKYDTTKPEYFWSLLGTSEDVALAYRPLVDRMTQYLNKGRPVKIALVHTKTPGETAAGTVVHLGSYVSATQPNDINHAISVNGAAPDKAPPGQFLFHPFDGSEQLKEITLPDDLVPTLVNFEPDIIIALTAGEIVQLVPKVDDGIAAKKLKRPTWILGQRNGFFSELLAYVGTGSNDAGVEETNEDRVNRFVGIQYAGAADNEKAPYDAWLTRMDAEYKSGGSQVATDYSAAENFYDAIYWLAYGLYAGKKADNKASDSDAIALGVRRLIQGTNAIGPGPDGIVDAFKQLGDSTQQRVQALFVGALGPPHIDEVSGVWRSTGSTYCYPSAAVSGGGRVEPRYDVQRYDASTGQFHDELYAGGNKKLCFPF